MTNGLDCEVGLSILYIHIRFSLIFSLSQMMTTMMFLIFVWHWYNCYCVECAIKNLFWIWNNFFHWFSGVKGRTWVLVVVRVLTQREVYQVTMCTERCRVMTDIKSDCFTSLIVMYGLHLWVNHNHFVGQAHINIICNIPYTSQTQ